MTYEVVQHSDNYWQEMDVDLCVDCVQVLVCGEDSGNDNHPINRVIEEWQGWNVSFKAEVIGQNTITGCDVWEEQKTPHFSHERCDCGGLAGDRWTCVASRKLTPSEAFALQA